MSASTIDGTPSLPVDEAVFDEPPRGRNRAESGRKLVRPQRIVRRKSRKQIRRHRDDPAAARNCVGKGSQKYADGHNERHPECQITHSHLNLSSCRAPEHPCNAIFAVARRNHVGRFFRQLARVSHRRANPGVPEHRAVIAAVSHRKNLLTRNSQPVGQAP